MKVLKRAILLVIVCFCFAVVMKPSTSSASSSYPYFRNETTVVYGINQVKCLYLCPSAFNWYDNGIPYDVIQLNPWDIHMFKFRLGRVSFTGTQVVDIGYLFGKYSAKLNNGKTVYFWAVKSRMIY